MIAHTYWGLQYSGHNVKKTLANINFSFVLHTCEYVFMCVCAYEGTSVHVRPEIEVNIGVFLGHSLLCLLRWVFCWTRNSSFPDSITSQLASRIPWLCLLAPGITGRHHACPAFTWFWGLKLQLSCSHGKHLICSATSLGCGKYINSNFSRFRKIGITISLRNNKIKQSPWLHRTKSYFPGL